MRGQADVCWAKIVSVRMANHNLIAFAMTVTTAAIADRMRPSPPSPDFSQDRAIMAQRFGPPAVLRPAANTGRIGKGRKSDGGTKIKPGRVKTVRNPG